MDCVERRAAEQADIMFTASREQQLHFQTLGAASCCIVPDGVDCAAYDRLSDQLPDQLSDKRRHDSPTILHLSRSPSAAAAESAEFLAHDVMPRLRWRHPQARLQIVGARPEPRLMALSGLPGIDVIWATTDVRPY